MFLIHFKYLNQNYVKMGGVKMLCFQWSSDGLGNN